MLRAHHHLPLYRQARIYARQGIDLDRSTLMQPKHRCHLFRLSRSSHCILDNAGIA
ncbi:MAG: hypothetical protein E5Y16_16460 [Mesorhizobium sp.]|uniref:IS66 family transposase n=1 Tax=Mesorhizobium sp. TaxID=1871066 RepID=UPI000FE79CA6|nr:MAG: hypothetical protein EOS08_30700 [Mesorhizobium sp.]RWQ44878.1 MAG: hypothetical protein EOS83_32405 [Mesorhizobium sp.]TIQ02916.1 MAG: hypothetical protein E5X57_31820 [Mesorhizobium sp.]TJV37043.1 MAG: hypothetical protein E5Y16_16460 [Mesorhizobium sp.]